MERPVRILISEDKESWQDIFKHLLNDKGYEIRSARNLDETKYQLDSCYFDLVLVDISLDPDDDSNQDGLETIRIIHEMKGGTQAIVLTGYGNISMAVSAIKDYDIFDFLEKSKVDQNEFLVQVEKAIKKAENKSLHLNYPMDYLHYFRSINLNDFSSMLGMKLDRLSFFITYLIKNTSPISPQKTMAQVSGSGNQSIIVFDYWSKAYACGAVLKIGKRDSIVVPDQELILACYEEDDYIGLVEKNLEKNYFDYVK